MGKNRSNRNKSNGKTAKDVEFSDDSSMTSSQEPASIVTSREDIGVDIDSTLFDDIEEKLDTNIEAAGHKLARVRCAALSALTAAFRKHHLTESIACRMQTLCDLVSRNLRRSVFGADYVAACDFTAVLCVQAAENGCEDQLQLFADILRDNLPKHSTDVAVNSKVCLSLAVVAGLHGDPFLLLEAARSCFHQLLHFARTSASHTSDSAHHLACLIRALSLCCVWLHSDFVCKLFQCSEVSTLLCTLLDSQWLVVRVSCCQLLALLAELSGTCYDCDCGAICLRSSRPLVPVAEHYMARVCCDDVISRLEALESARAHTQKCQRHAQHEAARHVLHYIQGGEFCKVESVRFGDERLLIESWSLKTIYSVLAQVLESGIHAHLEWNETVREWLQLGPRHVRVHNRRLSIDKEGKVGRMMVLNEMARCRQKNRGKQRDLKQKGFLVS